MQHLEVSGAVRYIYMYIHIYIYIYMSLGGQRLMGYNFVENVTNI